MTFVAIGALRVNKDQQDWCGAGTNVLKTKERRFEPLQFAVCRIRMSAIVISISPKLMQGCSFVCFVALHPKSTAVVMAHFFLGKLEQAVNQYFVHILSLVTDNNPS